MTLVVDASVLITLARIGLLDLLQQIAGTVYIPEAVYEEVVKKGQGRPGSQEVVQRTWILRKHVHDQSTVARLRSQIGWGEAEAIVLARELRADAVILDDATARRVAEGEGQTVLGLLGLLIHGKKRGLVRALKPIVDEMIATGFFIDDALYRSILLQVGEEPLP